VITVSTSTICESFRVIDTIMVLHTLNQKGFLGSGGYDFAEGFEQAKALIRGEAERLGGDAVINCDFELRVAITPMMNQQVFEIFCFGTVVKIDAGANPHAR
jgi:uncharacterized protein YbjQ (UPF0145 family)